MSENAPIFAVAALVSCAGAWWFHMILKERMATLETSVKYSVYALIWLAYFILIVLLATQSGAPDAQS